MEPFREGRYVSRSSCRGHRPSWLAAALMACCVPGFAVDAEREQRFREYDARRTAAVEQMVQRNDLLGAMARLYLAKDVETANRIIMEASLGHWLEHIPQLALYEMFNADTGHRAKLLSREATDRLREHMWECFQPKHGKPPYGQCRHSPITTPGDHWGNQNHGFVYQSWFATAAAAIGRDPKYTARFNPETHIFGYKKPADQEALTLAAYAGDLDRLWRNRLERMAKQGIWAEDAIYRCYGIASTYNLAYHSKDPVVRERASMMLDLHWLIYALHMVDGELGGAKNRFKPQYERDHFDRGLGQFYFGGQGGGFHSTEVALFGDYVPPAIAYDLLADPRKRGCFAYRERLTQFSSPGQPPRTSKYSYVTPEYVLGSYIAHELDKGPGRYQERAFNGIVFGKARSVLRLEPIVSFQSYHFMQHGPILLGRWYGNEKIGADSPWAKRYGEPPTTAKILPCEGGGVPMKPFVFEGGWLFAEAADAYFALQAAGGRCTVGSSQVSLPMQKSPFVLRAGGATEDGSFADFKKRVLASSAKFIPAWAEGRGPADVTGVRCTFTAPHFEVCSVRSKDSAAGPQDVVGVTFPAGGGVFPQVGDQGVAGLTAIQHHNVLLVRKRPGTPQQMAIRFDVSGDPKQHVERHGAWWVCQQAGAYVAVRELPRVDEFDEIIEADLEEKSPRGAGLSAPSPLVGNRLNVSADLAPVALVAGGSHTFPTREAFLASLDAYAFKIADGVVTCSFKDAKKTPATMTVGVEATAVAPTINGKPVENAWTSDAPTVFDETPTGTLGLVPLDGVHWTVTYADDRWGTMEFRPYPGLPSDQWRRIDGKPEELSGRFIDSPYLWSDYDSGIVTAEFNGRRLVLDFPKAERREGVSAP